MNRSNIDQIGREYTMFYLPSSRTAAIISTHNVEEQVMDILKMGAEILSKQLGGGEGNSDAIQSALAGVLGGEGGGLDIGSLVSGLQSGGLADVAASWLGDGENAAISSSQLQDLLGSDKIGQLASALNSDEGSILSGLQDALPQMVDKSSSGGNLLDSVGGLGGLANLAKGFLK
ncbi:MAG: YidB family protein [Pseudomonadales bacterium]